MALPTVQYERVPASTGGALHSIIMPKLHTHLIAAGWAIMAADADAIGAGSAATPAWDKTPATGVSCGVAIYRMPANDFTRQWFIEINPRWGAGGATNIGYYIRVGTGEAAGALTGAGAFTFNFLPSGANNNSEVALSVSEDGFCIAYWATSSFTNLIMSVERARSMAGVVGEDLIVQGNSGEGIVGNIIGMGVGDTGRYRASDGLEYATGKFFGLASMSSSMTNWLASNNNALNNMSDAAGEVSVPVGPFASSGMMAGVPRLMFYLHPVNAIANTDHPVYVDGATRLYRTPATLPTGMLVAMVARE